MWFMKKPPAGLSGDDIHQVVTAAALVALFLLILGHLSDHDIEQAALEQQRYCEHVKQGLWPDFKQIYNSTCRE